MDYATGRQRLESAVERTLAIDPATLAGNPITGIYRAPHVDPFNIASTDPSFRVREASVTAHVGDSLVHAGITYRVRGIEPDGTGWSVLRIELAA